MPGGDDYYDEIDDGIVESLIIVGLAAALVFLVYYRQQRQVNHRRAMEQQGQGSGEWWCASATASGSNPTEDFSSAWRSELQSVGCRWYRSLITVSCIIFSFWSSGIARVKGCIRAGVSANVQLIHQM
jgi:hypothetical protein